MDSVGTEVLTLAVVNISVCWYTMPYSQLKVNRLFSGTCHVHHQG
jgi:hypothetical protein